jgi:predicted transcriptional regulator
MPVVNRRSRRISMPTDPSHRTLGELQHAIMDVLWRSGEATVTEVHDALRPERELAPTTVATMLSKMERRGAVTHRTEGRRYVYRPLFTRDEVRRSMVGELVQRLFGGDPTALVSHLLHAHAVNADELAELGRLLDREAKRDTGQGQDG